MTGDTLEQLRVAASHKLEPQANKKAVAHLVTASIRALGALDYLVALDDALGATVWNGLARRDVVDVAHARWAVTSAVSGLDFCAAILARIHAPHPMLHVNREADLGDLVSPKKKLFATLRPHWQTWVTTTTADPRYARISAARHALTHSSLTERITGGAVGHDLRGGFAVGHELDTVNTDIPASAWIGNRDLVLQSASVATDHVLSFLNLAVQHE